MEDNYGKKRAELGRKISREEERKQRSRAEKKEKSVWFGLGMFGLVGWAVTVPTVISIAIGVWIDKTWKTAYSFTLMFLFIGIVIGCLNAWFWIQRERKNV